MTLSAQVQKDFTKISPKWAELYQTYKFDVMMHSRFCKDNLCKVDVNDEDLYKVDHLDIQDGACCVLGEAYGFKGKMKYKKCATCDNFSYALADCERLIGKILYSAWDEEDFEKTVKAFVKHFKSKHKYIFDK